jgi:hypothetical protein
MIAVVLSMPLATAAMAAADPSSEPRAVFDPFEVATPIANVSTGDKPVRMLPQPVDPFEAGAGGGEQFGHGRAKLAADEQLPGLSTTVAPSEAAADHWTPRPLSDMTINIQLPNGMLPRDYWAENPKPAPQYDTCGTERGWPMEGYHWCASCLCYQPLYFEEPNLERYGYGCGCYTCCCSTCIQSAASAAHFFGTVPALPYMMAANCPCECNYALGDYRPGDCNPWRYQCCAPCSAAGGIGEGAAAYGMILMLP